MKTERKKILVIGYGNPARADDGLGPAIADSLEYKNLPGVTVDANYQLAVEDSAQVAEHDVVIFADASVNCAEPFTFEPLQAKEGGSFSSHSVEPYEIVKLAQELFHSKAKCFTLAVRGYEFEKFGSPLSEKAKTNLKEAVDFLEKMIKTKKLKKYMNSSPDIKESSNAGR